MKKFLLSGIAATLIVWLVIHIAESKFSIKLLYQPMEENFGNSSFLTFLIYMFAFFGIAIVFDRAQSAFVVYFVITTCVIVVLLFLIFFSSMLPIFGK